MYGFIDRRATELNDILFENERLRNSAIMRARESGVENENLRRTSASWLRLLFSIHLDLFQRRLLFQR